MTNTGQNVHECSRQSFLECFSIFCKIFDGSGMFYNVLEYSRMLSNLPQFSQTNSGIASNVLECFKMFSNILLGCRKLSNVFECFRMYLDALDCSHQIL